MEQACFHALGLIGRNCEYLDQHLAHVGADEQTRQAVNDISAASARLDRTDERSDVAAGFSAHRGRPRGSIRWTCASCCSRSPRRPIWCRRSLRWN
ncbi:MAG: hypothetical protein ACLS4Y_04415 [Faecalibacterium sp.]